MGGMFRVEDQPSKSADKPPSQLIEELVASDAGERLVAEAALSSWVVHKMLLAKKASAAHKDNEVRMHFQEVIDTVGDAVRRTLPAAWMYQALSTAMEGCEYPGSEIRRVLLSSIDFGGDVEASIKIGKYLAGQGLKREALGVFHDAYRSNPMLKEPLQLGLELSSEIGDQDGIRWTCLGILSQAWTDDNLPLIQKAELVAKASFIRLNNAKDTVKAEAFEKEMKQARLRDLIVRVVWTGEADIDISVEDPTGTICDKNNTRTLSGGLMLTDGSSLDKPSKDGFSETYVCANGYAGQYRILIRKVWGEVSGGKVTVNLLSDYGTANQRVVQHQVPIQQDAIVAVDVKSGHRKEPIVDAQLAKVQTRMAEASAVLAQANPRQTRDNSSGYSSAYQQLFSQYAGRQNGMGGNGPFGGPFIGRGVVGYRPIIQTIPQGTFMTALSVISGDRRYVRVTPAPNFTEIQQVFTFNTFTGGTGGGAQGGGGQGGGAQGGGGGGGFGGGGAF